MATPANKKLLGTLLSERDGPVSNEELTQLLLAKLEEMALAMASTSQQQQPPTRFLLDTEFGTLLWNMVGGILCSVCCFVITRGLRFCERVRLARRALQLINSYGCGRGAPNPQHEDACEGARVLATSGVTDATPIDMERLEEELIRREKARAAIGDNLHWKGVDPSCEALSVACSSGPSANHKPNTCGGPVSPSQDTVNTVMSFGLYLPNTTLASPKEADTFSIDVQTYLPRHTQDVRVTAGSTFLSATVSVGASAVTELLRCAICVIKEVGLKYDSVCTVQLGNTAFLYGTAQDSEVGKTFLNEGLPSIPIITSAKGLEKRTIVIKGLYLESTEIIATTQTYGESTPLNVLYYQKLEKGLEVLLAQLPKGKLLGQGTRVHAKKTIKVEGCTVGLDLRSNDEDVDITTLKSTTHVFGILCTKQLWICLSVVYAYQVVILRPWQFFRMESILLLIIWLSCYFLIEYAIGPWIYNVIVRLFELMMRLKHLDGILASSYLVDKKLSHIETVYNSITSIALKQKITTTAISSRDNSEDSSEDSSDKDRPSTFSTDDGSDEANANDPSWEWPCFERTFQRGRWVTIRAAAGFRKRESTAKWPFEVIKTVDRSGESVELVVRSPHLIQVLSECHPKTELRFQKGSIIDPKELFLRLESLRHYCAASRNSEDIGDAEGAANENSSASQQSLWHVKHLLRFVESHFADTLVQYERINAEGCVSFEMLWAFFVPGERVCRRCVVTNQECFATVRRPAALKNNGQPYWSLTLAVMDFNVQSYHKCTMKYQIHMFDGEVPFTSLQVCPVRFFPNCKEMEARFVSQGAIFYQVAMQQPFRYMQFNGSLNFHSQDTGCWRLHKLNADGRVMVDLLSFARMNPDYPLENAEPPCEVMTGIWSSPGQMKQPNDEELMLAPAFAYGFSFRLKRWGCFEICGLRETSFSVDAFDALRMKDERQKMILWSVVQPYIAKGVESRLQSQQNIDPIAYKGTGCIVLCHGPPGTGKTLTAEALAETLQCPLWSISAYELGEEPNVVEAKLCQIMEIAHNWGAVLLLDEADAYLQRRDEGVDVQRNLLTGVFLRVLEYYRGIMFLTTNRVTAFDDAILSRTTLAIAYPALDDTQRREIWKKLLLRAGIRNATYDALLHHEFNGRQIRNIIHLAQLLADGRKEILHMTHVIDAINAYVSGTNDVPLPGIAF